MKFSKKKKDDENKKGITESFGNRRFPNRLEKHSFSKSFLEGIPGFGDFFRELGKTETFKKRFEEVDEKIEENLRKGEKKRWGFEANISVRPLSMRPSMKQVLGETKKETSKDELEIKEDYAYGKKGNKLLLAVKVPKEDVDLSMGGKNLFIKSDNFEKRIELPDYYRNIMKKHYKKGILMLELTK